MTPTIKMLNAWFDEKFKANGHDEVMYWAGIAAYAHLSSPGSEQWRREHGFLNDEEDKA
jgi:hypothetical protein